MAATPRNTFEPDGRAVPFIDEGEGPTVVLLPAQGFDITYLSTLASVLVEEDFRVLRIGTRRPGAADAVTLHDLAQDVIDVLDSAGVDGAWIGGHAFGGTVARTVALDHHDRVDGVLLLGVEGADAPAQDVLEALAAVRDGGGDTLAAIGVIAGAHADAERAASIVEISRDPDVTALQDAARAATPEVEWSTLAPNIPVLVIQGELDVVTPEANGHALAASAPAFVTAVQVPGAGHLFAMTHPGETSWVIEDYLDWD